MLSIAGVRMGMLHVEFTGLKLFRMVFGVSSIWRRSNFYLKFKITLTTFPADPIS